MLDRSGFLLGALLLLFASMAHAGMAPLLDSAWLVKHQHDPHLVLLDIQPVEDFRRYHLPASVNAPYAQWRTAEGMLPGVDYLEQQLGRLGISQDDPVLIVATGLSAGDMAAAARVFWTLHVLGHKDMSILNGGLAGYARRYGVANLTSAVKTPRAGTYKASPRFEEMPTTEQVRGDLSDLVVPVDARSVAEYLGLRRGGPDERPGTLPDAHNLPFDWLTVEGGGELLPTEAIKRLITARGIPLTGQQIHFCHTGSRAALTWFASHALLGNTQARLYDGSTAAWARRPDLPIERKLDLGPSPP